MEGSHVPGQGLAGGADAAAAGGGVPGRGRGWRAVPMEEAATAGTGAGGDHHILHDVSERSLKFKSLLSTTVSHWVKAFPISRKIQSANTLCRWNVCRVVFA